MKKEITIEQVIAEIMEGGANKFGINKTQFSLIQNYENQTFIDSNGKIGVIKLEKFIKVIPKIKKIRLLTKIKGN